MERSERQLLAAITFATLPGGLTLGASPLILGALIGERGLSEAAAAACASAELLAMALSAVAISGALGRFPRLTIALAGGVLFTAAQLGSIAGLGLAALLAMRAAVGAGAGLTNAASTAAVAAARDPDRLFAMVTVIAGLLGGMVLAPVGLVISQAGLGAAFAMLALTALVSLPAFRWLPPPPPPTHSDRDTLQHWPEALALLVAIFLVALGQSAAWGFAERIASNIGVGVEATSIMLAVTALVGLLGAGLAVVTGARFGRALPVSLATLGTVASIVAYVRAETTAELWLTLAAWSFLFAYSYPLYVGAFAALDRAGRWAAAGGGVAALGAALGPGVAGLLVAPGSYDAIATLMIACGGAALLCLSPVLWRLDRRRPTT